MDYKINDKKIIFGVSGSGKSYLTKKLCLNYSRLIIIDPLEEYSNKDNPISVLCKDFVSLLIYVRDNSEKFRVSLIDNSLEMSEKIFKLAWELGNITIVIEEVDMICSPSFIGAEFANVIKRGRHKQVNIIANSRRPSEVNRLLTSQASEIYVFKLNEPTDVKYISNFSSKESENIIANLDDYNYYHYPSGNISKIS